MTSAIEITGSRNSTEADRAGAMDFEIRIGGHEASATLLPCECCSGRMHGLVVWGATDNWLDSRGMAALREIAGSDKGCYVDLCGEIESACNDSLR